MYETAIEILKIAKQIYDAAELVKANQDQSKVLAKRVKIIADQVQTLQRSSAALYEKALRELLALLQECLEFITKFQNKSWLSKMVFGGSHQQAFADYNDRLQKVSSDLSLGMQVTMIFNREEDKRAAERDSQQLQIIIQQNQQVDAKLDAMARQMNKLLEKPHKSQKIKWKELAIVRQLGEGSFAKVYLGQWEGGEVAVKKLNADNLPEDVNEAFTKEAEIHGECHSPNIVRLFGITQEPGNFALVMEYCQQGSLYNVLHKPSIDLPWETRWEVALDVARGLAYLHDKKGIFHRDLKSLNIVLDDKFKAKITDFGQSKLKMHATTTGTVKQATGTVSWRAPETFKAGYKFSAEADVYSYGMILWEIATREYPFGGETDSSTIKDWIKEGSVATCNPLPEDCPSVFRQIIQNTWGEASSRLTAKLITERLEAGKPARVVAPPPVPPKQKAVEDERATALKRIAEARAAQHSTPQHVTPPPAPKPVASSSAPKLAVAAMPALNQAQVNKLLQHVAYGEQDQAEALIKTNPNLLLGKGTVTDYSGRTFNNLTPFQYALWAYDWHLWTMLTKYLPQPAAQAQLRELEAGSTAHGKHYDFNPLLSAYKTYIDNYDPWTVDQLIKHWNTVIGKLQTQVPAHVAQEYCHPERSFEPTPSFKEPSLKRTFKLYEDEDVWYPVGEMKYGFLGRDFGVFRYNFAPLPRTPSGRAGRAAHARGASRDFSAVAELCKVRTAQYEELKARLR